MGSIPIESVSGWVSDRYALSHPSEVMLLRAYTNDVFLIKTASDRHILKIYGAGWRSESELRYEVDLVQHLRTRGILVAQPIPGLDHQAVQTVATPAGPRFAVLFSYAAGTKPQPPFPPALYELEGRANAALHRAADDFITPYDRRPMNLTYLLDQPTTLILPLLARPDDHTFFARFTDLLGATIASFAGRGLDWGPCHGDLTFDNLQVTSDRQIVWYDFDSGGPGWRAGDLQGWAARLPEAAPRWEAFRRGYHAIRPIEPINFEATPYLFVAFRIWGMEVDLQRRIIDRGDHAVQMYLAGALNDLRRWAIHFGFPD